VAEANVETERMPENGDIIYDEAESRLGKLLK